MCDQLCERMDTLNIEKEYEKFIKTKPALNTGKLYKDLHLTEHRKCPYLFKGYGIEVDSNPMYRTVNSEYGYYPPNPYTIPTRNFPLTQTFTNSVFRYGMYRNFALNTQMDKKVY